MAALQKTVKSQTASIKALQSKAATQTGTIATLQSTVTSQASTISALQGVVGATAADGLRKSVADIAANPALTLSWLPTYLSLDSSAINGVTGPNIVLAGCNLQIKSSSYETDTSGTGNLIVGWDDQPAARPPWCAPAPTTWSAAT